MPADGSGPEERLATLPGGKGVAEVAFSPDGRFAVLREDVRDDPRTRGNVWLLPLGGSAGDSSKRTATPLLQTGFDELMPRVSPSGRWVAYVSDETGQFEVYVRAFPGPGGRVQVSSGGGTEPVWAPDGRLYYRSGGRFMAARLAPPPSLAVARRDTLFEDHSLADVRHQEYDALPGNNGFVVLQRAGEDAEIVVVLNWLTELRARMSMNASGDKAR